MGLGPVILLFIGGFLGGLLGAGAGYVNMFIFRSQMSKSIQYIVTAVITVTATAIFFIVVMILTFFIHGVKG